MLIEQIIVELSTDPFNPKLNFAAAVEYEKLNQTASAVSFYLRAAEYGVDTDQLIVYTSLLKMAHCFRDQNDRNHTVSNSILQAIAYIPTRPEAYFLMSQFHEQFKNWQEAYTWAQMGLEYVSRDSVPLPANVGYVGPYGFIYEKAISGYWLGRKNESIKLLKELMELKYMLPEYEASVKSNLERIGNVVL